MSIIKETEIRFLLINVKMFFSNRNTKYTYNVKVVGVESILLEVLQDQETAPGTTGEVIYLTNNNIYTLDSHYETALFEFNLDDLVSRYEKAQGFERGTLPSSLPARNQPA